MTPGPVYTLAIWVTVRQSVRVNVAHSIRYHICTTTQLHTHADAHPFSFFFFRMSVLILDERMLWEDVQFFSTHPHSCTS